MTVEGLLASPLQSQEFKRQLAQALWLDDVRIAVTSWECYAPSEGAVIVWRWGNA